VGPVADAATTDRHDLLMHTNGATPAGRGPDGVLLLIDIENMIGTNTAPDKLREQVCRLVQAAGAVGRPVQAVAAYSDQRSPRAAKVLAAIGVEPEGVVPGGASAADAALLDRARRAAQAGYADFVVASADGAFAGLAKLGRLHVVAWTDQPVAAALTKVAVKVYRLPRIPPSPPATRPMQPTQPASPAGPPSRHAPPSAELTAGESTPAAAPNRNAWPSWPGGDPVRLVGQGALFGLGVALAARLVDYLFPRRAGPR
jgi:hypothetical protein